MKKNKREAGDDSEIVSKSAQKRQMHQLQYLGESLLNLNNHQRAQLDLSDSLIHALDLAKNMKAGNTKRRQLQLIGKLMRHEDADAMREQLASFAHNDYNYQYYDNLATQWCQRLMEDSHQYLEQLFEQYPQSDVRHLHQLTRLAIKERSVDYPSDCKRTSHHKKHQKRLFSALKHILSSANNKP